MTPGTMDTHDQARIPMAIRPLTRCMMLSLLIGGNYNLINIRNALDLNACEGFSIGEGFIYIKPKVTFIWRIASGNRKAEMLHLC